MYHCSYFFFPFFALAVCTLNRYNESCQTIFHSTKQTVDSNKKWMVTGDSSPQGKSVEVWNWPVTSLEFQHQGCLELWLHSSVCLHGVHRDNFPFLQKKIFFSNNLLTGAVKDSNVTLTLNKAMMTPTVLLQSEPLRWPTRSDRRSTAIAFYSSLVFTFFVVACGSTKTRLLMFAC